MITVKLHRWYMHFATGNNWCHGPWLRRLWEFPRATKTIWLTASTRRIKNAIRLRFRCVPTQEERPYTPAYWSTAINREPSAQLDYDSRQWLRRYFPSLKRCGIHKLWFRLEYLDPAEDQGVPSK